MTIGMGLGIIGLGLIALGFAWLLKDECVSPKNNEGVWK